jgi:hypothetical protein
VNQAKFHGVESGVEVEFHKNYNNFYGDSGDNVRQKRHLKQNGESILNNSYNAQHGSKSFQKKKPIEDLEFRHN